MSVPEELIDIHVHGGPSLWERKHDMIELARLADEADLGGFVLKSHFGNTFVPANLAADRIPNIDMYASLTLNAFVGGFNPTAVELGLETGVSIIWMPTFCSANFETSRHFPFSNQSMTATDEDGEVKPSVKAILETLADGDRTVILGNGHLSPSETYAVLDTMEEMDLDNPYLITHADSAFMNLSIADQVDLAKRGAVIEKCYLPVIKDDISLAGMAESIREIGVKNCVLSTDHGQTTNASPPDALRTFVIDLMDEGFTSDEIVRMGREIPRSLLGEPI
jgi:hypothetical protein